ncbi:MAG: hypothetical protein IE933_01520 [Sphingomonadales bacterium]|nr:hypothetical protein [Sphingomonadales bacterium]MBD3771963.1 hypothetical protein [Paracoccaceae bacterium]
MKPVRAVTAGIIISLFAGPAMAAPASDFGGLAICSTLKAMPRNYRPGECSARNPLKGECRFSITSQGRQIDYLIENGVVIDKVVKLRAGARSPGPFGIVRGEAQESAARKIWRSTKLTTRYWTDSEDADAGYLQSDDVGCGRNKSYTVYVWFRHGRAESVSVSTLPAI